MELVNALKFMMIPNFKPMLAQSVEKSQLEALLKKHGSFYLQPKLDGIRCIMMGTRAVSRTLKDIPNRYIRQYLKEAFKDYNKGIFRGYPDGELMLKNPNATFQEITSAVMSEDGEPDFCYQLFDTAMDSKQFYDRYSILETFVKGDFNEYDEQERLVLVHKVFRMSVCDILAFEDFTLQNGYEGVILRWTYGTYKFGRSTLNEGYLLKMKTFKDAEAEVLDLIPKFHNANKLETSELGYAKRSSSKANLIQLETLGAIKARGINGEFKNVEFDVGSGFTAKEAKTIWLSHQIQSLKGKIFTYTYQPKGSKDKPRCPIFKAFRRD